MDEPGSQPRVLLAHKGYHPDFSLADIEAKCVNAVVSAKVQLVINGQIYGLRNLVERCISNLKHSNLIATPIRQDRRQLPRLRTVASIRPQARNFVQIADASNLPNLPAGETLALLRGVDVPL